MFFQREKSISVSRSGAPWIDITKHSEDHDCVGYCDPRVGQSLLNGQIEFINCAYILTTLEEAHLKTSPLVAMGSGVYSNFSDFWIFLVVKIILSF